MISDFPQLNPLSSEVLLMDVSRYFHVLLTSYVCAWNDTMWIWQNYSVLKYRISGEVMYVFVVWDFRITIDFIFWWWSCTRERVANDSSILSTRAFSRRDSGRRISPIACVWRPKFLRCPHPSKSVRPMSDVSQIIKSRRYIFSRRRKWYFELGGSGRTSRISVVISRGIRIFQKSRSWEEYELITGSPIAHSA